MDSLLQIFIIDDQFFEQYEETLKQVELTTEAYHKSITNGMCHHSK